MAANQRFVYLLVEPINSAKECNDKPLLLFVGLPLI